ncbi:MAG: nucleoid-structuring protein H-NS [Bacteroidota bacterium]
MIQSKPIRYLLPVVIALSVCSCKKNKTVAGLGNPQEDKETVEQELEDKQEEIEEDERTPLKAEAKLTAEQTLNDYFNAIANASSTSSANSSITEALTLFSSPDAPLLIVFYEANGKASYDEPTTIEKYLNYLKDTKNNSAQVDEIVTDGDGKIKEIVLKK